MKGFTGWRSALMVLSLGLALVFAGCAYTSMSEKEMMKESGAMKSEGMKKYGQMIKNNKQNNQK